MKKFFIVVALLLVGSLALGGFALKVSPIVKTVPSEDTATDDVSPPVAVAQSLFCDVKTLPTENINENVFYRVSCVKDFCFLMDGEDNSPVFKGFSELSDVSVYYEIVDSLPSDHKISAGLLNLYILESTGVPYCDLDDKGLTVFAEFDQEKFYGWFWDVAELDSIAAEASEAGYAYLMETKIYSYKNGVWTEVTGGSSDGMTIKSETFGSFEEAATFIATNPEINVLKVFADAAVDFTYTNESGSETTSSFNCCYNNVFVVSQGNAHSVSMSFTNGRMSADLIYAVVPSNDFVILSQAFLTLLETAYEYESDVDSSISKVDTSSVTAVTVYYYG